MGYTVSFAILCVIITNNYVTSAPQDIISPQDNNQESFFRSDYKYVEKTNRFYKVHSKALKFSEAVDMCSAEGAKMIVPETEEEAIVLRDQMTRVNDIWIGLHDIFSEGDFLTLDGKSASDIYVNWNSGEPNDAGDGEDCVIMGKIGTYNDVPCTQKYPFVCSRLKTSIEINQLCQTYDNDYFYNIDGDRCYKLHVVPRNWQDAFKICRAEMSDLATINSAQEAKVLTDIFNQRPIESLKGNFDKGLVHVDFSDLLTPGVYLTSKGQSLQEAGYDEWAQGQPDNYNNVEHCGSMFRDTKLNDVSCTVRAMFFCEKTLGKPTSISVFERVGEQNSTKT